MSLAGNYAITPTDAEDPAGNVTMVSQNKRRFQAMARRTCIGAIACCRRWRPDRVRCETTPGSQVTPGSAQVTITTGSPPPTPETRARVTLASAALGAAIAGNGITFTRNNLGVVGFTVQMLSIGNYTASVAMVTPQGWVLGGIDVPSFNVATQPPAGAPATQGVNVTFTAGSGAANTSLVFTLAGTNTGGMNISVTYALPVAVTGAKNF